MENGTYTNESRPEYNDVFKRVFLSLFAAHFIVVYGDSEQISNIIKHFDYYNALIASFVIAFLVLYYIWMITRYLDARLDWFHDTNKRAVAQILLGVVPPTVIAILLAWVYFSMYGYKIQETPYFDSDFPVILLLIFLANIYYFLYYLVVSFWHRNSIEHSTNNFENVEKNREDLIISPGYKKVILVHTLTKSIPVPVEEIAYFFREQKQNFLRKIDGEIFDINLPLDELEAGLDPTDFFRINRQMIICFSSCKEIKPSGARLELGLLPEFKDLIVVSETKVAAFKKWINR